MNNYHLSEKTSEALIGSTFFLACIILIGGTVIIAMTAYPKKPKPKTYVVQSGYIEITPSGK